MSTCPAINPLAATATPRPTRGGRLHHALDATGAVTRCTDRPRIALLVETALASGREVLQGVARYTRGRGGWITSLEPHRFEESVPAEVRTWDGHGIIARVHSRHVADAVFASGVPAVDVLGSIGIPGLPLVHTDDGRISRLAAEHLVERGLRHFGFVGLAGEAWSARRRDAFTAAVAQNAHSFHAFELSRPDSRHPQARPVDLAGWLDALPKPIGIMLCSDQIGPPVLDACRRAGADVPGDVAIIGVDDDEPICDVCGPGLSSVWPDHSQVGYEAARLLDRLMSGQPAPLAPVLVSPRGVVTRGSTDISAGHDPCVAAAVRHIRDHACDRDGLTIDDVAARISVSRRLLQRRFRRATGRTLHDEMLRVRLSRARTLLTNTDLPISAVAAAAGFRHQEYMGAVFRQKLGVTPARYRRALQE